jgi:hypothetical protein
VVRVGHELGVCALPEPLSAMPVGVHVGTEALAFGGTSKLRIWLFAGLTRAARVMPLETQRPLKRGLFALAPPILLGLALHCQIAKLIC